MEDDVKSYGEAVERVSEFQKREFAKTVAVGFLETVAKNIDNETLTDEEFRRFIRNSMKGGGYGYKDNGEPHGN